MEFRNEYEAMVWVRFMSGALTRDDARWVVDDADRALELYRERRSGLDGPMASSPNDPYRGTGTGP